jgi:D-tyrosyl-tRNA(Tyr) deacylase
MCDMKTVVQRVSRASVRVEDEIVAEIGAGIVALVGGERGDGAADAHITARKMAGLRIFPGRTPMDRTLADVGGACLVVSQFTLAGSVRKGRRPSFDRAELPELAEPLYLRVVEELRSLGVPVETGRFGAHMHLELVNDGPVTLLLLSEAGVLL